MINEYGGEYIMWHIKKYDQLQLTELEQILKLRQSIFILEQESFFEDIDGNDQEAIHIFNKENGKVWAYTRILEYENHVILARVTVDKEKRGDGSGRKLLEYALNYLEDEFPTKDVHIVAMSYLRNFYQSFGFKTISKVYYMDNDPHEDMILTRLSDEVK